MQTGRKGYLAADWHNPAQISHRVRQKRKKHHLRNFRKFALSSLTLCHATARGRS